MIAIGIGANLPMEDGTLPRATCARAVTVLGQEGCRVRCVSRWYRSAPVPVSDQPWFINGVALIETALAPAALLALLHAIEARFGRARGALNAARCLDLDLLTYHDRIEPGPTPPLLPHPRLEDRAFVLRPLAELAPHWVHPVSGRPVSALVAGLDADQICTPIPEE